jgi:hypothetical protein
LLATAYKGQKECVSSHFTGETAFITRSFETQPQRKDLQAALQEKTTVMKPFW